MAEQHSGMEMLGDIEASADNTHDIGKTTKRFKKLYLAGAIDDDTVAKAVSELVPYSGATGDVNLGAHDLITTGNLTDGTNTLTIANAKAAYDHVAATGASHSYIDQSVVIAATPTFENVHISSGETYELIIEADTTEHSADRTLTFDLSNADRTLSIYGDSSINQGVSTGSSPTFVAVTWTGGSSVNANTAYTHANGSSGADHTYINQSVVTTATPQFVRLGIGKAASATAFYILEMEFARANNFGGGYIKNTSSDGITRFSVGLTNVDTTLGILEQYDNEDGRGLFLNRKASTGTMEMGTTGGYIKVLNDGGVEMLSVYSDIISSNVRDLQIDDAGRLGYVSSSIKYKKNVADLDNSERIFDLRPVKFDLIDGSETGKAGLIAEEVDEVMPDIVSYKREEISGKIKLAPGDSYDGIIGYKKTTIPETVNYTRLIVPLLKEVQKLKELVDILLH